MKSSTQDQAEARSTKWKGEIKEIAGKLSKNPTWKQKEKTKRWPAKFKKRSARFKEGLWEVGGRSIMRLPALEARSRLILYTFERAGLRDWQISLFKGTILIG